jgi:hypothetical protein
LTFITARWPKGTVCPKCGEIDNAAKLPCAGYRQCRGCRAQFNVLNGTPMEGTHLPLRTWFGAIFLTATSSNGALRRMVSERKQGRNGGFPRAKKKFVNEAGIYCVGQATEIAARETKVPKHPDAWLQGAGCPAAGPAHLARWRPLDALGAVRVR